MCDVGGSLYNPRKLANQGRQESACNFTRLSSADLYICRMRVTDLLGQERNVSVPTGPCDPVWRRSMPCWRWQMPRTAGSSRTSASEPTGRRWRSAPSWPGERRQSGPLSLPCSPSRTYSSPAPHLILLKPNNKLLIFVLNLYPLTFFRGLTIFTRQEDHVIYSTYMVELWRLCKYFLYDDNNMIDYEINKWFVQDLLWCWSKIRWRRSQGLSTHHRNSPGRCSCM